MQAHPSYFMKKSTYVLAALVLIPILNATAEETSLERYQSLCEKAKQPGSANISSVLSVEEMASLAHYYTSVEANKVLGNEAEALAIRWINAAIKHPDFHRLDKSLQAEFNNIMGMAYSTLYPDGHKKDDQQAIKFFKDAALADSPNGLAHLGEHYLLGRGIEANNEKARYLIALADKKGSPLGQAAQKAIDDIERKARQEESRRRRELNKQRDEARRQEERSLIGGARFAGGAIGGITTLAATGSWKKGIVGAAVGSAIGGAMAAKNRKAALENPIALTNASANSRKPINFEEHIKDLNQKGNAAPSLGEHDHDPYCEMSIRQGGAGKIPQYGVEDYSEVAEEINKKHLLPGPYVTEVEGKSINTCVSAALTFLKKKYSRSKDSTEKIFESIAYRQYKGYKLTDGIHISFKDGLDTTLGSNFAIQVSTISTGQYGEFDAIELKYEKYTDTNALGKLISPDRGVLLNLNADPLWRWVATQSETKDTPVAPMVLNQSFNSDKRGEHSVVVFGVEKDPITGNASEFWIADGGLPSLDNWHSTRPDTWRKGAVYKVPASVIEESMNARGRRQDLENYTPFSASIFYLP